MGAADVVVPGLSCQFGAKIRFPFDKMYSCQRHVRRQLHEATKICKWTNRAESASEVWLGLSIIDLVTSMKVTPLVKGVLA